MAYVLFISENKLKESTAINMNVDVDLILPHILVAQKIYLEPKLGTDLYQKLEADKNKVNADGVNVVLNMPISNESKVETLVHIYDMTEEKAENIVGDGQITED